MLFMGIGLIPALLTYCKCAFRPDKETYTSPRSFLKATDSRVENEAYNTFIQNLEDACKANDELIEKIDDKDSYELYDLGMLTYDSFELVAAVERAILTCKNSNNSTIISVHLEPLAHIPVILDHLFKKTHSIFQKEVLEQRHLKKLCRDNKNPALCNNEYSAIQDREKTCGARIKNIDKVFSALVNINKLMHKTIETIRKSIISLKSEDMDWFYSNVIEKAGNYDSALKFLKNSIYKDYYCPAIFRKRKTSYYYESAHFDTEKGTNLSKNKSQILSLNKKHHMINFKAEQLKALKIFTNTIKVMNEGKNAILQDFQCARNFEKIPSDEDIVWNKINITKALKSAADSVESGTTSFDSHLSSLCHMAVVLNMQFKDHKTFLGVQINQTIVKEKQCASAKEYIENEENQKDNSESGKRLFNNKKNVYENISEELPIFQKHGKL
ncbi:hypothetical protein ENBRE01_1668 [Enteropsectra breve]|nr:hypothetical protein ENBRE01_1668 [Enteropsectra breve]